MTPRDRFWLTIPWFLWLTLMAWGGLALLLSLE